MTFLENLRQTIANIEAAVAILVNHPEPTVNSVGQTIGLHIGDAKIALDNAANDLNKVEADTRDATIAEGDYAATANKPLE